jgi:hypothetical protein
MDMIITSMLLIINRSWHYLKSYAREEIKLIEQPRGGVLRIWVMS